MTPQAIQLPVIGIEKLQAEAQCEGYKFLDTLVSEWLSGKNRFDGHGEVLLGTFQQETLIAVGGLNRDPFLDDPTVGRIRKLYVAPGFRNNGVGGLLLDRLVDVARQNFSCVRLRAESQRAAHLYERRGFTQVGSDTATHVLHFD